MPGLIWPRFSPPDGSGVRDLLRVLEDTQWWSPARLAAEQRLQLTDLLRHARANNRFYKRRLEALDLDHPLTEEVWRQVPVLTRSEVQARRRALRSTTVPRSHGPIRTARSSGSTGTPIEVFQTQLCSVFWVALTAREQRWHDVDVGGTLAAIRYTTNPAARPPDGLTVDSWGKASGVLGPSGPCSVLSTHAPAHEQLAWLQRLDPDHLVAYPSSLREVAHLAVEQGVTLPRLRSVSTLSEVLHPEVRELVRAAWDVGIHDSYSSQEVGYIGVQCPDHEHYHVQSESLRVEIVDDEGHPCGPGQVGRVLVTDLHNYATPLIRYELGDLAEPGEPCPCGRGLPVLSRVLGRVRNTLVTPDGGRYWQAFGTRMISDIAPIRQLQFVQTERDHIECRFVTSRPLTELEEEALREHLWSWLPYRFRLSFTYPAEIPRSAGGKYEDFYSLVTT